MILLKNYINLRDNTESVLRHLLIIQLEQYIWLLGLGDSIDIFTITIVNLMFINDIDYFTITILPSVL